MKAKSARSAAARRGWEARRAREAAESAAREAQRARRSEASRRGWARRKARERSKAPPDTPRSAPQRFESPPNLALSTSASPGSGTFPEARHFQRGSQLLGWLEGRPGIIALRSVERWPVPSPFEQPARHPRDAAVEERIARLPLVAEASPEDDFDVAQAVRDAYDAVEEDGAIVEVEVDSESGDAG